MTNSSHKETMLHVRDVSAETKKKLQELSKKAYGKTNASQYVRALISDAIRTKEALPPTWKMSPDAPMRRIQISIPSDCLEQLKERAEKRFSTPNYFIASLIYRELGVAQLHADEVETLRNSNYYLAKVGININQIAKAFNQLVMHYQGKDKLPPIAKDMDKLKKTVDDHIKRVLGVLNAGTTIAETRGRGSGNEKRKATLAKNFKQTTKKPISRARKSK